jgi:hypothetical protein
MAGAARDVAPRSAVTRLASVMCVLSVALALAGVALAAVNGKGPADLVTDHHAIGILTTLVVAPIGALIVVLLFPDGRMPSRRWWPVGLAGALAAVVPTVVLAAGTWPLRGPALATAGAEEPELVLTMFWAAFAAAMALGAVSVVSLVLRFRRAGAVQRQQIKWFAYGAAPSIPLGRRSTCASTGAGTTRP